MNTIPDALWLHAVGGARTYALPNMPGPSSQQPQQLLLARDGAWDWPCGTLAVYRRRRRAYGTSECGSAEKGYHRPVPPTVRHYTQGDLVSTALCSVVVYRWIHTAHYPLWGVVSECTNGDPLSTTPQNATVY